MFRLGYYNFEGNTLLYEGGDDAYDLDSRDWIPVDMLIFAEFIGEYLDYIEEDDYSSNMPCDNTGLCDSSCTRLITGQCDGY